MHDMDTYYIDMDVMVYMHEILRMQILTFLDIEH